MAKGAGEHSGAIIRWIVAPDRETAARLIEAASLIPDPDKRIKATLVVVGPFGTDLPRIIEAITVRPQNNG